MKGPRARVSGMVFYPARPKDTWLIQTQFLLRRNPWYLTPCLVCNYSQELYVTKSRGLHDSDMERHQMFQLMTTHTHHMRNNCHEKKINLILMDSVVTNFYKSSGIIQPG